VFSDQKIGFQVTALAYQSMMSVVPFIAIGLYLTNGIGIADQFSAFLYANISNQKLIQDLLAASQKIIATAESGLFGFISMASFLWILIWLMLTVRRVFNNVWQVQEKRNFFRVLGVGIGVLILSPFVIALFFSGSVVYSTVLDYFVPSGLFFSEHLKNFLSWALFAGATVLILMVMYKFVPAARVHTRCAFKAALIAGIGFTAVQYLYLETQVMVAKQNAIYGVLAALPLFMIWLNIGWTIVLYGAELSYSFQHVNHLNLSEVL
jgi:membrane protein